MMKNLRATFEKHAFVVGLLAVAGYFAYFAYPALKSSQAFGHGEGLKDVASMNNQLFSEIKLAASILILIAILCWWRQSGFRKHNFGTLKFAIAPAVFTGLLLSIAAIVAEVNGTSVFQIVGVSHLLQLIVMTLMIGVFEEGLFRGVLYHGASTKFGPIKVVVITGVLFGSMHFVNFITGQAFQETVVQVIHAAIGGLMYGMLRLIIGAIWPVILLHAFWDLTVATIGSTFAGLAPPDATESAAAPTGGYDIQSFVMMAPELIYALVLYYVWRKTAAV